MSNEIPLHAQVALALGYTWRAVNRGMLCRFLSPPDPEKLAWSSPADGDEPIAVDAYRWIPKFTTDWSATGPLLLKFRIGIDPTIKTSDPAQPGQNWVAREPVSKLFEIDSDPLVAACRLLLKLHAAGKLKG